MASWFHRFLNPHCPHCREERVELKVCSSCETLKQEVERLRYDNDRLLNRVLHIPEPEPESKPAMVTRPTRIPWPVRKQMLEAEDRKKAELLRNAPKPSDGVEDLERELDLAAAEREVQGSTNTGTSA